MSVKIRQGKSFDLGRTSVLNVKIIDGGRIAGTYHGDLVIYDGRLRSIHAHDGQLLSILYNNKMIYTGGSDGYLRMRRHSGDKVGEIEVGGYVYGIEDHPKGLVVVNDEGRVFLVDPELKEAKKIFEYEERRPARDVTVVPTLKYIVVGFYDGIILVMDHKGKVLKRVFRTLGDSVTFLDVIPELNVVISGFRSGRISLIYYVGTNLEIRSGRSKKSIFIKPRRPVDLQTIGSVARRSGIYRESLLALGGNGTLYEQKLSKLLNAALSTRGTRIVARHQNKLHDYGANGAYMNGNELITAGLDGFVKLRSVSEE